jgi:hypothetical protein
VATATSGWVPKIFNTPLAIVVWGMLAGGCLTLGLFKKNSDLEKLDRSTYPLESV